MKGQENLPCMHKWEKGPIRFSMTMESTVFAVKQQIEQETKIPVSKQVLIARVPSGGGVSIRLRNDAGVKKYLEKLENNVPWHVTLLVAESLVRTAPTS
uniref:Ubiquitin-like domain-containing protein n=1 Tax=Globisporangium ultimum (strain ATCC 200006 / CBS 805.95 / DAOM BR144) TaxID=431595 RepID=K3WWM3_GLOUD